MEFYNLPVLREVSSLITYHTHAARDVSSLIIIDHLSRSLHLEVCSLITCHAYAARRQIR